MVNIAYIVPTTSKGFSGKHLNDTLMMKLTIPTFLQTINNEHKYKFFIGIDKNDPIYDNNNNQSYIRNKLESNNVDLEFIVYENVEKGHLTKMWNILFKKAYDEQFEYFFQGGDDLEFMTYGWVNDCIKVLNINDNIGVAGANNCIMRNKEEYTSLLTQTFVSRKHMELFGYYFPEEIKNWYCDDWLTATYKMLDKCYILRDHQCINRGGKERYDVVPHGFAFLKIVEKDVNSISKKLNIPINTKMVEKIYNWENSRFKQNMKFNLKLT
jgi:hypothetical protein